MERKSLIFMTVLLIVALALAACSDEQQEPVEVTRIVEVEVPAECPDVAEPVCPEVEAPVCEECPAPEASAADEMVFVERWESSPHNDTTSEAFNHWNEEDPAEIPTNCAKCHSTPGYQDFLGLDGSEAGVVNVAAPIGSTVECAACHNDVTITKDSVIFPSGIEVTGLGDESRCMECHQGRESTVSVDQKITDAGMAETPDAVSEDLGFTNIHYYAAAATQYGTLAKGGYEYAGKSYDARYDHVDGYNTCNSCHDPHTLEVQVEACTSCHTDVETVEDFENVRMPGSLVDYDGDGDMEEGIAFEIDGLREILFASMRAYASEVAGSPIGYDGSRYPYFFIDANDDGTVSEDEGDSYATWTPRLTRAAYNYQVSLKDPGRYAHGGKYIIQLLYDSTEDLNGSISAPVDMTALRRIDHGHFAGSEEAFRHWDADGGMVPGSCSRCHSAAGLPLYIEQNVAINQPASNGLACSTCHNNVGEFTIYEVESVKFPSGAVLALDDPGSNLCLNCHQGRESTVSVNNAIGDLGDDEVSDSLGFRNIHYFAAGATLFGTEAQGAYEFEGQEYNGQNVHVNAFNACTECHGTHTLDVQYAECADCHENVATMDDLVNIRFDEDDEAPVDYDGDGDVTEGIAGEIDTLAELLYAAFQNYAATTIGTPIVYNPARYPYFFVDADVDGMATAADTEGYASWTPALLRAAYNYQYSQKDPGAFAHNSDYVMQFLYDSIASVGGDVSALTRPPVTPPAAEE